MGVDFQPPEREHAHNPDAPTHTRTHEKEVHPVNNTFFESQLTGTPYAQLMTAEKTCHTIEIREKATGKEGVANTCADGVELFYGADDGSDDKRVTPEAFNRDFEITACLRG